MQKIRQKDQLKTFSCFFKKDLYEVKASGLHLRFNISDSPRFGHAVQAKLYQILNC